MKKWDESGVSIKKIPKLASGLFACHHFGIFYINIRTQKRAEGNVAKIAFLGLGVMGYPMAGHLARGGHQVTVFNRTAAKAEKWVSEYGGEMASSPAAAAQDAEFVFACVGEDADVRQMTIAQDGAFSTMAKNAVFIDNTTASADVARELYIAAQSAGLHFIDAPVSGGQAGAENGKLTVMCGGDAAAYERAERLMSCYGARVTYMGESGAGQLTKMVNQICIAGLVQGLSEALNFGQKANLDMEKLLGVISGGAAQSWQMENRGSTMVKDEFDFGFAVDWMIKDLKICLAEASHNKAELPVTALVAQYYRRLSHQGYGRNDTSSLIRLLR